MLRRIPALALATLLVSIAAPASADTSFLSGPYVDRLAADSATVHVRTAAPTSVRVVFETPTGPIERTSARGVVHRVLVSGLPLGTTVPYTVSAPGFRNANGSFRTGPVSGSRPVEFVVIGDSRDGGPRQTAVFNSVRGEPDFLLHLGDLVPSGSSVDEYTEFFALSKSVLDRTAIVPVLGNHELILDRSGELYREAFAMPDARGAAYYAFEFGGVRILVLDSNISLEAGSPQHAWAMHELERAAADGGTRGLFVAVHHGPMSSGRHGGLAAFATSGLTDAMRRAGVDLVLSGHDHIYERGQNDGLKYIVSGGGGSPLYRPNAREPYQLAFVPAYHHLTIRVEGTRVDVSAIRPNGQPIERCHFTRGGPFECERLRSGEPIAPADEGPVEGVTPAEDAWDRFGKPILGLIAVLALAAFAWRRMRENQP